jgi:hypothetical protein
VNALCYSKPTNIEMDRYAREDVDLVVIFGRMDGVKIDLEMECNSIKFDQYFSLHFTHLMKFLS